MTRPLRRLSLALLLLGASSSSSPFAEAQPQLAEAVRQAIQPCGPGRLGDVRVVASQGVVTLGGHVRTLHERECIAIEAERVEGVRFLEPRASVSPERSHSSAELEEAARSILRDQAGLEGPAPLTVEVTGGRLVLGGYVRIPDDKYRAEAALRRLEGIVELENHVRVDAEEGLRRMEVQLQELLAVNEVSVEGLRFYEAEDRVVISGRSHDVVARDLVERYARELPGGKLLVDRLHLVVSPAPALR